MPIQIGESHLRPLFCHQFYHTRPLFLPRNNNIRRLFYHQSHRFHHTRPLFLPRNNHPLSCHRPHRFHPLIPHTRLMIPRTHSPKVGLKPPALGVWEYSYLSCSSCSLL